MLVFHTGTSVYPFYFAFAVNIYRDTGVHTISISRCSGSKIRVSQQRKTKQKITLKELNGSNQQVIG